MNPGFWLGLVVAMALSLAFYATFDPSPALNLVAGILIGFSCTKIGSDLWDGLS